MGRKKEMKQRGEEGGGERRRRGREKEKKMKVYKIFEKLYLMRGFFEVDWEPVKVLQAGVMLTL